MSAVLNKTAIRLYPEWLRIETAGDSLDFHYMWLRHECASSQHPKTGERTLDPVEIDPDIAPVDASVQDRANGQDLVVVWPEGLTSRYDLEWLRAHAYARNQHRVEVSEPNPENISIHGEFKAKGVLKLLESQGAVIVRGWGSNPEADTETLISRFEAAGVKVRPTHFGRIEDLRTDNTTGQNTDQLGYTNAATELHSDQPFLEEPPRFQLLQSIRTATQGGESLLANGRQLAEYIKATSRQDYEILTQVPVVFNRKQANFEKRLESPLLTQEPDGRVLIRLSYFTLAPFDYSFDQTRDIYRAYRRLTALARSSAFQYKFLLTPGDFVIYDNRRMLHGRTAFSGPRWVRGIYFDPV